MLEFGKKMSRTQKRRQAESYATGRVKTPESNYLKEHVYGSDSKSSFGISEIDIEDDESVNNENEKQNQN